MRSDETLILIGAGGHGKVVLEALQASGTAPARLIVVDDNQQLAGTDFLGFPVTRMEACEELPGCGFHVAVGRNDVRRALCQRFLLRGAAPISVVHPGAVVSPHARTGAGVFLAACCVLAPDSSVADGVIVNHGAVVDHDCEIGEYSHIAPHATLGGNARIGSGVLVGAAAVIMPGVTIGNGCTIGAGAVVLRDVPSFSTVVGVPGRAVGKEHTL